MKTDEQVLCAARADLPPLWLMQEGFLPADGQHRFEEKIPPIWLPRHLAETDPSHKQVIPYGILSDRSGAIACYPRAGSEKRLHSLWSIGVGGHINPCDLRHDENGHFSWAKTTEAGFRRELLEEFPAASHGTSRFLGWINEEKTSVGTVHIGLVFHHRTALEPSCSPGEELAGLLWLHPSQIGTEEWPFEKLELWSRLALHLLSPR